MNSTENISFRTDTCHQMSDLDAIKVSLHSLSVIALGWKNLSLDGTSTNDSCAEYSTFLQPDPATTLGEQFLKIAQIRGSYPAVITPEQSFSYQWILEAAQTVRSHLENDPNFHPGSPVAMMVNNSPEYLGIYYGILLAQGVAVPLPPDVEIDRLAFVVDACDITTLMTTPDIARRRHTDIGKKVKQINRLSSSPLPPQFPDSGEDLATILFTSGSTGAPKGVMLSHKNLMSNSLSIIDYLELDNTERALAVLPFCHTFGNSVLQSHVLTGNTLVLGANIAFPGSILQMMEQYECTSFSAVPEVFHFLLTRTSLGENQSPNLRYMSVAGGALNKKDTVTLSERIHPAKLFVMYGQTEATARISYLPPDLLTDRLGSVGTGLKGHELQVVNHQGEPVLPGERGEIRTRGPNITKGYWKDPETTAQIIRQGWLYTGDLATIDADGFVYPVGRSNALLKIGGHRFHPNELETFIQKRFTSTRAVVVGYQCSHLGTRLALYAKSEDPDQVISSDAIAAVCRQQLPTHKIPTYIEILDEFPLNSSMKLDRPALSQRASQRNILVAH